MPDPQMPPVPTLDAYREIYHRDDIWRPVIEAVCHRYSFLNQPCERGPDGSHIVYFVGEDYVVKLFVPLFAQDFEAEHLAARHLAGKMEVTIPEILAEGEIAGWDYLVMTRISGTPLQVVWDELSHMDRIQIASDVGKMIAHLRSLPISGLDSLGVDWSAFLAAQVADLCANHPPVPELAWEPRQEIAAFFASLDDLQDDQCQPVLLLADITREHVLVEGKKEGWRMVSYLDFGDAMLGQPDYEMIAPGLEIAGGDPEILRSLLLAAGYPEKGLDHHLSRRLMAYTLIHRFVDLTSIISLLPHTQTAASLDQLAHLVWPLATQHR